MKGDWRSHQAGRRIAVGLGDIATARDGEVLVVYGIGSCVAVIVSDRAMPVAALAHVVLPDSGGYHDARIAGRYADTAVAELKRLLQGQGGRRLGAMVVGGASLLGLSGEIGRQNVQAVEAALRQHRIPVLHQETGGTLARTVQFNPATRRLSVQVQSARTSVTF